MSKRLSTKWLRWLTVILPVAFWIIQLNLRTIFFDEHRTVEGDLFAIGVMALGAIIFSNWVFGIVDNREKQIQQRTEQLNALREASLALTTELELGTVLQRVVDLSRALVGAKYGALGVLDKQSKYIEQFITSGITPEQRARLGDPPRGHGLLGAIIKDGKPLRIPDIARDPRSVGFPPNHPPMHSLLGVPIRSKGKVIGDLYMTDKTPEREDDSAYAVFSEQDQNLLELFAAQAAIAIENAQLYRQTQQLAVLQERERFGMDLHDGIIQSIYAIGLTLEDAQFNLPSESQQANERIGRAIHGLNDVIRDIRNYILDLRPQRFQGRNLKDGLEELVRDLRANSFLNVHLHADDSESLNLSPEQTVEVLHIAQEALSNVRKHARATRVDMRVGRADGQLALTIADDGVGLNSQAVAEAKGYGLRNMRERAHALGGDARIERREEGGTRFTLRVPLP